MKQSFKAGVASLLAAALIGAGPALAEEKGGDKPAAEAKSDISLPPLPADKSVKQTMVLGGKTLSYTATVGSLPVRDGKGKVIADVVFTAYTLDGAAPGTRRPVTFAFNGGPGAASVYLNLGAIGPKRVQFGAAGDAPSDSPALIDNPASWLDFTDLVFIDPVGTGYSRSLVDLETTKKTFFGVDSDIAYLSRVVFDWLVKNGRMASPKYVTGESYGGFRAPRITYALQTEYGVGVSGVVMVSPFLDAKAEVGGDFSPMPWITSLPSMAAAELERQGKPIGAQAMAPIEAFARGDMVVDLLKGSSDEAAFNDLVTHVATYTGLDPRLVRTLGGRIDSQTYLRERRRAEGKIGSWYDSNVVADDPFPWSADRRSGDPILDSIIAPTTSAYVDFATRVVGWKAEGRYNALSGEVGENWEKNWFSSAESVTAFRKAVAADPKMKVLVVHGYGDLSCPYFVPRLVIDQMPKAAAGRVRLSVYPGGHMFYSRPDSGAAFRKDVAALFEAK